MKNVGLLTIAMLVLASFACAFAADFEPIPEAEKEMYTFDLERNFYPDEAAFEAELETLSADVAKLEALKGKVAESSGTLYEAYYLSEKVIPPWWKLWVYAYLRYATNTEDSGPLDKIEKASGDLESRIQFVKTETQDIDDATLKSYFREKPELEDFAYAMEEARRYIPYTLSLPEEELMSTLSPYLGSWSEKLYQKLIDRTEFPDLVVDGDTFDVNLNYSVLINSNDRQVRKDAWKGYFGSMADHRDLYSFALMKGMETRNKTSAVKGYRNFAEAKFFGLHLEYDDVAEYFDEIADHAYLRKEYEKVRRARIMADMGYDSVYIWDRTVQKADFDKPRFDIHAATGLIKDAMQVMGAEYQGELSYLLDPANRRLDIVGSDNRSSGMFATGYPGEPWQFFSMSYNGYLNEVSGLAHESGHAVHHKMQTNAGVRPIYADGPSYVTESVAMTSELLIGYGLYSREKDLAKRAYYLEQFLENAMGLLVNNMFAHLEFKMYEGVEDGSITGADDFDALAAEMTVPYSMYYGNHPEYKGLWSVIHHYYDVPMYNINYVVAQSLALVFFDKLLNEPGFVDKYESMLRSGFDEPAPEIILETTGVDMMDPDILASGFAFIKDRTDELSDLYAQLGIEVENPEYPE
ncbi:M3 family oligoendopeptidase [Candidatus Eisenbacteria bacterium]|uniref:M3 family oligoendopeptidase n=1 Tax=Eiseniibacteriota bacterium TaxID=2212470 RepID=A0ABV6YNU9_UNCEI